MKRAVIKTQADAARLCGHLMEREMPYTVSIKDGATRSDEQNRTQQMWYSEMAEQDAEPSHDATFFRCYYKLHFGVPIMRRDDEYFRKQYDDIVKPLAYEHKMTLMAEPFDFPVTRLMTTKQKTEFLETIFADAVGRGLRLTMPKRS